MSPDNGRQPVRLTLAGIVRCALIGLARLLTGVHAVDSSGTVGASRVYFANHCSHADSVLLWAVLPRTLRARVRPIAAADYWAAGRLRHFLATAVFRSVLIDRVRRRGAADPVAAMVAALDDGDSLILFPEGTRNTSNERLLQFRSGLFRLSLVRPRTEFVPVWIENPGQVLPKGALLPVPHACSVRFGPAIRRRADETQALFLRRARQSLLRLAPEQTTAEAIAG